MPEKITGRITGGQGHAHINYAVMIPPAAIYCPTIADCGKFGSINIDLDRMPEKGHADCWTEQITWSPLTWNDPNRREAFGFTQIKFEFPVNVQTYEAWIIFPEGHPFCYSGNGIEVISAIRIPGIERGKVCAIHFDHIPSKPRPTWFGKTYGMK